MYHEDDYGNPFYDFVLFDQVFDILVSRNIIPIMCIGFMPDLPKGVEQILLKALAKDPKNRYQRMGEFAVALEKSADRQGRPTLKERKPARVRQKIKAGKPVSPNILRWLVLGLVGIALLFGASRLADFDQMAELILTSTPAFIPTPTFTQTPVASPTTTLSAPTQSMTITPTFTATPSLGISSSWERPADGMMMMYVPEGEFQMGSNDGNDDEKPIHIIFLDAFWMDKTEVTNEMYHRCVNAKECDNPGFGT